MSKRPKTAVDRIVDVLPQIIARGDDTADFNAARLSAIEDRLAAIDGGPGATEARVAAFEIVNTNRRGTGRAPLGFKLK